MQAQFPELRKLRHPRMETQIACTSNPCTVKRTTLDDLKFSKKQMKYFASLLNDSYQIQMLKNALETYHSEGNEYFKRSQWEKAVEQYSLCIQCGLPFASTGTVSGSEIKRDILAVAASNRTQALLNLRRWDKALLSAEEALKCDPKHVKSLYRKAKALEGLQDYVKACTVLEYALELRQDIKVIKDALDQCKLLYHQSVTGEYGIAQILCRGGPAPIVSDFVGPVEIKSTTYSGRGLFLTEAVDSGKLLVVSNGFAFGGSSRNDRLEQFAGLTEEMLFLCHSSEKFLHQVHYLRGLNDKDPTRAEKIPPMELFIPGSDWSPDPSSKLEIPSTIEVWGKALGNSFDAQRSILPVAFGEGKTEVAALHVPNHMGAIGVWALPSFFNHSCTPNCSTHIVGRAMFVRAAESMPAGQELTISYISSDEVDRNTKLRHWNFKCKCERCLQDEGIRPLIEGLLAEAEEHTSNFVPTPLSDKFPATCRLVARIEDAIKNLPMELGEKQKNWIRFTFQKVYLSKLHFEALMTRKEKLDLLKLIHAGYDSINLSTGSLDLQVAVSIFNTVEAEYGKSSVEYEEERRVLGAHFTKSLGNVKEEEIDELIKTRFSKSDMWF